jgi:hypothetical protein
LRENASDAVQVNEAITVRTMHLRELTDDLRVDRAHIEEHGRRLRVYWANEKESTASIFDADWLRFRDLDNEQQRQQRREVSVCCEV